MGITLTYCLGALLHWQLVCLVCGLFPVAVFLAMIALPETPPWLVLHGKLEQASHSSSGIFLGSIMHFI